MKKVMLGKRFVKALSFSAQIHLRQYRKGTGIPYVSHLMAVCAMVLENGGDEDLAIAALLHDAIEDAGGMDSYRKIASKFGRAVADVVMECSDSIGSPKPPWEQRKIDALNRIGRADKRALLVEAADKVHNARAILSDYRLVGNKIWKRFNAKKADILWYYSALVREFKKHYPSRLTDELAKTVKELNSAATVKVNKIG